MSREYPCVHFEKGLCRLFTDAEVVSHCLRGPCKQQQLSNADRIRAMSDEELAEKLYRFCDIEEQVGYCKNLPECEKLLDTEDGIPEKRCIGCLLYWLKQPAEGD